jgi:hypothetical protein
VAALVRHDERYGRPTARFVREPAASGVARRQAPIASKPLEGEATQWCQSDAAG